METLRNATNTRIDWGADTDLQTRVINFLANRLHHNFGQLEVSVINGTVTLHGVVTTQHEKHLALNCCQRVAGVIKLVDKVQIA